MISKLPLIILFILAGCSTGTVKNKVQEDEKPLMFSSNQSGKGPELEIELKKGSSFYYPLFAIWLEDENGKYIQTLYVAKSVATGIFKYGKAENGKWQTAAKRAPQTLPYWAHKRGELAPDGLYMPDPDHPVPDAYTGATPTTSFILTTRADQQLPQRFRLLLEINQNWDWNEYWTNDKYPDDENYKMSCQPALVYSADIDLSGKSTSFSLKPVGHSHYSGKTGELFTDLSTLTTALKIVESATVRLK